MPETPEPDESYADAITPYVTEIVGEPGFHIDAQTRNALRKAYDAGFDRAEDLHDHPAAEPTAPDFDQWIEEYIEDHERITSD